MKKLMLIFDCVTHNCSWFSCTFTSLYSSFSTKWVKQISKHWGKKNKNKKTTFKTKHERNNVITMKQHIF